jgi:hypothetical protein
VLSSLVSSFFLFPVLMLLTIPLLLLLLFIILIFLLRFLFLFSPLLHPLIRVFTTEATLFMPVHASESPINVSFVFLLFATGMRSLHSAKEEMACHVSQAGHVCLPAYFNSRTAEQFLLFNFVQSAIATAQDSGSCEVGKTNHGTQQYPW